MLTEANPVPGDNGDNLDGFSDSVRATGEVLRRRLTNFLVRQGILGRYNITFSPSRDIYHFHLWNQTNDYNFNIARETVEDDQWAAISSVICHALRVPYEML